MKIQRKISLITGLILYLLSVLGILSLRPHISHNEFNASEVKTCVKKKIKKINLLIKLI